ncbi:hypothetical protein [Flavivirga rizhaonensis]|uniref:Uncharacterized protein n=1 Tax=Flavivirga rizhaonensis TaxID=2559571 RepID=A0A4S1DU42_9FLAO|nr:hypothetical protein [Flavivirga rizhaonensis]TGV01570.1 hypothetical protein EM932_14915 [Flavivirga rizhaonensis]
MLGLGGSGHFKAVLQRRKDRKDKNSDKFDKKKLLNKRYGKKLEFNSPNLRASELERLKAGIRSNLKKDRLKDYLLFLIIFLILFTLFYYFMN